jgi:hypothetical protein
LAVVSIANRVLRDVPHFESLAHLLTSEGFEFFGDGEKKKNQKYLVKI